MDYATLKLIHQSAVATSFAGFFARGVGMLGDAGWVKHRLARTLPHLVDTVLIVSAVWLTGILRLSPSGSPWIDAKIAGLFVYIGVGMVAFRFGRTRRVRAAAWIFAMIVFAWIVSVAITKDPRGFVAFVM
jgi:uncharacterized membrane protein SirB2